jgi:hypothetical protein
MNNSFENLPDLQKEQLLDFASRFTTDIVDAKGNYKGNAFIAEGRVISAHHVVYEDYRIDNPRFGTAIIFEQLREQKIECMGQRLTRDQDIAVSKQQLEADGFKKAKNEGDGQRVYLIGRNPNNMPFVVSGKIMTMGSIHRGKMEVSVNRQRMNEISNGMSGSAVTNLSGEAIGVLVQARVGGKGLMEPFE